MRALIAGLFSATLVLAPTLAQAAAVDASLVPDGTYVVKVEKVDDASHITVMMQNGVETTLAAQGSTDFSKLHASQTVKLSVIKGKVPVYIVQ